MVRTGGLGLAVSNEDELQEVEADEDAERFRDAFQKGLSLRIVTCFDTRQHGLEIRREGCEAGIFGKRHTALIFALVWAAARSGNPPS